MQEQNKVDVLKLQEKINFHKWDVGRKFDDILELLNGSIDCKVKEDYENKIYDLQNQIQSLQIKLQKKNETIDRQLQNMVEMDKQIVEQGLKIQIMQSIISKIDLEGEQ